ncbi:hypothetical protein OBBRIDRAFT_830601 [Obba rivulosa]|uniref:Uncharacterized protein n=1 Tax=Obba rivulosa TaxID=1052685 RepID=A0A8E2J822_9APHY|nr:hypothetical protein OBBRIDRAFT_830601 [Obba rivulosa]
MNIIRILNSEEESGADQISGFSDPPPEEALSGVRRSARPRRTKTGASAKQSAQSSWDQSGPQGDKRQRRLHTARLSAERAAKTPDGGRRQRTSGHAQPQRTGTDGGAPPANDTANEPAAIASGSLPLSSPSPARDLLKRAQQGAEADAASSGRRPFIMDIILDSRPPVSAYSEDVLMDAIERSHAFARGREREYVFTDRYSLDSYWADQAALWRGVADEAMNYPSAKRFRTSAERSTVSGDDNDARSTSADEFGGPSSSPMTPYSNMRSQSFGESHIHEVTSVSSNWDSDEDSSVKSPVSSV